MNIEHLYSVFLAHTEIVTDSRKCIPGSMFFALKGANFDGNRYAAAALECGCAYAVVDDPRCVVAGDGRYLLTDDVLTTLQQLARHHRRALQTPMIAITGTNGKTTTKELIASVLSRKYCTLFTEGNLNNHIGVPLTLLRLRKEHQMAVVEMGANHPGEIRQLANIAEPDHGIITNVGVAHLEGFGSEEGVLRTKGELYDFLRPRHGSRVFIDNDSEKLVSIADGLFLVRYGTRHADGLAVEGRVEECRPQLSFSWKVSRENVWRRVDTQLIGVYNICNALAAATIGTSFGIGADDICDALACYRPTNNRSQLIITERNRLVVDTYNANPTSMAAALDNFDAIASHRKMAILGDMRELGEASEEQHLRIINRLKASDIDQVWLVGREFSRLSTGFRTFHNVDEVKAAIVDEAPAGCLILIKGSNGERLFELPPLL